MILNTVVRRAIARGNGSGDESDTTAHRLGIPIVDRSWALQEIMDSQICIAVTGAQGRTSTAAMLAHVLSDLGSDPSWILGADLVGYGPRSRAGQGAGALVVLEADPSVLAAVTPDICVVSGAVDGEFRPWIGRFGTVIAAHEEKAGLEATADGAGPENLLTYGPCPDATWVMDSRRFGSGQRIVARNQNGEVLWADVPVPVHADNAMGALAAATSLGVAPMDAARALESYQGHIGISPSPARCASCP